MDHIPWKCPCPGREAGQIVLRGCTYTTCWIGCKADSLLDPMRSKFAAWVVDTGGQFGADWHMAVSMTMTQAINVNLGKSMTTGVIGISDQFSTDVIASAINFPPVSLASAVNFPYWPWWGTLSYEYLRQFSNKHEKLHCWDYQEAGGRWFIKNLKVITHDTLPLKWFWRVQKEEHHGWVRSCCQNFHGTGAEDLKNYN